MSRQICLPINQVKLTNVATVRLTKAGKRFEIACYRNKVLDYRAGVEKDLSEVLQTDRIFTNVSKGQFASTAALKTAFNTADEEAIAVEILQKGQSLQVSDLERAAAVTACQTQIATWVAAHTINRQTGVPYTFTQIQAALIKSGFTVQTSKQIKPQCLAAVKFLKNSGQLPLLERAPMELALQYCADAGNDVDAAPPTADDSQIMDNDALVRTALQRISHKLIKTTEKQQENSDSNWEGVIITLVLHVDPSSYRELNELAKTLSGGRLEILHQVVTTTPPSSDCYAKATTVSTIGNNTEGKEQQKEHRLAENKSEKNTPSQSNKNHKKEKSYKVSRVSLGEEGERGENNNNSDDEGAEPDVSTAQVSRKNQRKALKKKKNKQKRRQQRQEEQDQDESTNTLDPNPSFATTTASETSASTCTTTATPPTNAVTTKPCTTCGGEGFRSLAEYRAHFRSDWHRFNLQLKMKKIPVISEEEFLSVDQDALLSAAMDDLDF